MEKVKYMKNYIILIIGLLVTHSAFALDYTLTSLQPSWKTQGMWAAGTCALLANSNNTATTLLGVASLGLQCSLWLPHILLNRNLPSVDNLQQEKIQEQEQNPKLMKYIQRDNPLKLSESLEPGNKSQKFVIKADLKNNENFLNDLAVDCLERNSTELVTFLTNQNDSLAKNKKFNRIEELIYEQIEKDYNDHIQAYNNNLEKQYKNILKEQPTRKIPKVPKEALQPSIMARSPFAQKHILVKYLEREEGRSDYEELMYIQPSPTIGNIVTYGYKLKNDITVDDLNNLSSLMKSPQDKATVNSLITVLSHNNASPEDKWATVASVQKVLHSSIHPGFSIKIQRAYEARSRVYDKYLFLYKAATTCALSASIAALTCHSIMAFSKLYSNKG